MSFSTLKIPLLYVLFFVGLVPWIILLLLTLFYEPFGRHGDPFILIALPALLIAPFCLLIGFFQSLKFTGIHRNIGLTLNGISLAVLLCWVVYDWLTH